MILMPSVTTTMMAQIMLAIRGHGQTQSLTGNHNDQGGDSADDYGDGGEGHGTPPGARGLQAATGGNLGASQVVSWVALFGSRTSFYLALTENSLIYRSHVGNKALFIII